MRNNVLPGFETRGTVCCQTLRVGRFLSECKGGFHLLLFFVVMGLTAPAAMSQGNPIQLENQQPGASGWEIPWGSAGGDVNGEIKGYASAASVNKGGSINFHISVNPAQTYTWPGFA